MSIPANDALTLNARSHSGGRPHGPIMSSRRSSTRSPSPQFIFSSSLPTTADSHKTASRRSLRRRSSNASTGHVSDSQQTTVQEGVEKNSGLGIVHETPDAPADVSEPPIDRPPLKIDWEIPRKLLHSSIGFLVIPLYTSHTSVRLVIYSLSTALAVIVPADMLRLRYPRFAKTYESLLGFLMRESEKNKTNGVIWYIIGVLFVLCFYPLDIAVVSILILSWCDTTASTFGRMYGRYTRPLPQVIQSRYIPGLRMPLPFARRKSLAGFLASCITGTLISFVFWGWLAPMGASLPSWPLPLIRNTWNGRNLSLALGGVSTVIGLVAGVSEAIDVGSLDDNLTLPIISGGVMWAMFRMLDWALS